MSDHTEVARLLIESRAAHQQYRQAAAKQDAPAKRAFLTIAAQLRAEAHTLDAAHDAPAWREPEKFDHAALTAFYAAQLA